MSFQVRRADKNQPAVVARLREYGWTVRHTHTIGNGFPDVVASRLGLNILIEIKHGAGTLTREEMNFFATWPGLLILARTPKEAREKCEALFRATDAERQEAVQRRLDRFRTVLLDRDDPERML